MGKRVMIIDKGVQSRIEQVKLYCEKNPLNSDDMFDINAGVKNPPGGDERHIVVIPNSYKVVYTQEHQPNAGLCHHISVSIPPPNMPNLEAVRMVLKEFGMNPDFEKNSIVTLEDLPEGNKAVNIIEPVKE